MHIRPYDPEKDEVLLYFAKYREEDVAELTASNTLLGGDIDVNTSVIQSVTDSGLLGYIALDEDEQLVGVGGLVVLEGSKVGIPWMVATDLFKKNKLWMIKAMIRMISLWKAEVSWLVNAVDIRNEPAIKTLEWLGFDFPEGFGYEAGGTWFRTFRMKGDKQDV